MLSRHLSTQLLLDWMSALKLLPACCRLAACASSSCGSAACFPRSAAGMGLPTAGPVRSQPPDR